MAVLFFSRTNGEKACDVGLEHVCPSASVLSVRAGGMWINVTRCDCDRRGAGSMD